MSTQNKYIGNIRARKEMASDRTTVRYVLLCITDFIICKIISHKNCSFKKMIL